LAEACSLMRDLAIDHITEEGANMRILLDPMRIVRVLAFALRHNPSKFELDLDPEGWTCIDKLTDSLRLHRPDLALLDWPDIESAIGGSDRFEVHGGKIRAAYGHSVALAKPPDVADPPPVLFHGTSLNAVPKILQHGLVPMTRRFVHLSSDVDWIIDFLSDKREWAIFAIRTETALKAGMKFRKANFHVWLAESMGPRFLVIHLSNATDGEIIRAVKRTPIPSK